jgi:hypothetical protein
MQKRFYYKFFKSLGLFANATFTDSTASISFNGNPDSTIFSGGSTIISPARYYGPNRSYDGSGALTSTEPDGITPVPYAGILKSLYLISDVVPTNNEIFRVYVNGVATAMTVTLTIAGKLGFDITHPVSVPLDGKISIYYDAASFGSVTEVVWSCEYQKV